MNQSRKLRGFGKEAVLPVPQVTPEGSMENRTPRSKPVNMPTPVPEAEAETPAEGSQIIPGADYQSLGSTRVVAGEAGLGKTHVPADTEIKRKETDEGKKTDKDVSVLGDFELLNKLGEGAMGEVWKARRISFDGTP